MEAPPNCKHKPGGYTHENRSGGEFCSDECRRCEELPDTVSWDDQCMDCYVEGK